MSRIVRGLRFAVGLSRGIRRGDFLRPGPEPVGSPDGTQEAPLTGSAWARLRREPSWFTLSRHRLVVHGLTEPLTILHLTDLHLRGETPWLEALCAAISGLSADLLVLTGDVVTRGWTAPAAHRLLSALPDCPLGRYAVMGNWEYWAQAPPDVWEPLLAEHGVALLIDEHRRVGPITLVGLDDLLGGQPDVASARGPWSAPGVVLAHCPAMFPEIAGPGVALVLSGHSHGGQVRVPGWGPMWVPHGTDDRVAGWFREGESHLFVSRGLGWSVAPLRMWCPPEIALLELVPS